MKLLHKQKLKPVCLRLDDFDGIIDALNEYSYEMELSGASRTAKSGCTSSY